MIGKLAFLGLIAFTSALFGIHNPWNANIHTHFEPMTGFYKHPWTVAEALEKRYKKVENPQLHSSYSELEMYVTESDKYLVGLSYDETEQIAALSINLPKDNVTSYYDMESQGFTSWTYESVEYWTISMYFVSADKNSRINSADSSKLIRDEYLTVEGLNGALEKIPTTATKIAAQSTWVKEACIPMMGQHYYYNMSPELSCDKPFFPWFPLTDEATDQIIGVGFMGLGKTQSNLESPFLAAVKMIVPTAPECLYNLVNEYGAFTLHTYFIDHPRLIMC